MTGAPENIQLRRWTGVFPQVKSCDVRRLFMQACAYSQVNSYPKRHTDRFEDRRILRMRTDTAEGDRRTS